MGDWHLVRGWHCDRLGPGERDACSNPVLPSNINRVYGVVSSQDGRLASISTDSAVIVWDLENGTPAQTLFLPTDSDAVTSVAWSQDGRLASG